MKKLIMTTNALQSLFSAGFHAFIIVSDNLPHFLMQLSLNLNREIEADKYEIATKRFNVKPKKVQYLHCSLYYSTYNQFHIHIHIQSVNIIVENYHKLSNRDQNQSHNVNAELGLFC
jgi:hypothetical protein